MRNRWVNTDVFESRYPLSIEQLARQETFCPIEVRSSLCSSPTVVGIGEWRDIWLFRGLLLTIPPWMDNTGR